MALQSAFFVTVYKVVSMELMRENLSAGILVPAFFMYIFW